MSKRVQSSMRSDDYDYLKEKADKRGVSVGTFIRWILGGWASQSREKEKRAEQEQREEGKVYGP